MDGTGVDSVFKQKIARESSTKGWVGLFGDESIHLWAVRERGILLYFGLGGISRRFGTRVQFE